ncbi:hypothetical protein C8D81_2531 [Enemella evansiae]|nr:hypothetical protein C8D81_2531 [Enemella evansiae]
MNEGDRCASYSMNGGGSLRELLDERQVRARAATKTDAAAQACGWQEAG